jgi:2-phospho-L-lactate/phosphoenolpyruvate guanylyltransferase
MPIKSPARAKRRLAEALDPESHRYLIEALIEDALAFCSRTEDIVWWVVSDDETVRARAQSAGLEAIADKGVGLNEAVAMGFEVAARNGAQSVLVIPGDVPLARPEDADDILDTGAVSEMVVVPASDGGTNGLYLDLPTEVRTSFGEESLRTYVEQARQLDLRCSILDLPRLAIDLDTPEDARVILQSGDPQGKTMEVLAGLFD